ncbi:hypothetical protein DM02DRAFT_183726 [Periconia macrospinosa]|uniref:Only prolin and serin are matching in the corresponding protein n=1 Tax=Periconia macrospinosa TaxID=97972 RepID=A0A2V1DBR2_9PLEO|nr:hypothetical protein DM02DRAFT_183726 [Periconia macrospinosa]
MRDMKPLMLPKLVAQRKSSKGSLNMPSEHSLSIHSNTDSGFYSASECSTPPTPSYQHGHLRFPSTASSLSSSPPSQDCILEPTNASGKLPQLTEDVEREDDYVSVSPYRPSMDMDILDDNAIADAYDFADYGAAPKRRRSVESSAHSVSTRLERSFPSLSRKMREQRKRASTMGKSSRSNTPSRHPSTRSSSITSSIHQTMVDLTDSFPPSLPATARSSKERLNESIVSLPIDIAKANDNALQLDVEEIEAERFASTPLLPPMLSTNYLDDTPTRSPLQSPTVATTDPIQSVVTTPVESPSPRPYYATPPLSTKASITSFKTSRPSPLVPSTEIPPIMLADSTDKWAHKLGHDNFTIFPEPYMPEVCDATTRDAMFADWQQARANFTKHQVRMAEHYGPTSTIYGLCEQKWEETDAEWKKNYELVNLLVPAEPSAPSSPTKPVVDDEKTPWPTLIDPKSDGKFPQLGDEDIVGPMERIAPRIVIPPITPRKRAFFKFFSDLRFSTSFLGRPSTGVRGH